MPFRSLLLSLLCFVTTAPLLAQSGNTHKRISTLLHYTIDGNPLLTDSFIYTYHGDMGSIFSEERYDYRGWGYDGFLQPVYDHSSHLLAPGGLLDVRYDTLRHYQMDGTGQLSWYQQWQVGWNGTSITNFDRIGYGQDYFRYRTAQEAGGNGLPARIYNLYQNASSTSWDTASVRYLRYDAQGRLEADSIYNVRPEPWMPDSQWYMKNEYRYLSDGRLQRLNLWVWQNNGWVESNGYSYFYDFSGQLRQVLSGRLRGTATVQDSSYRQLYEYDGGRLKLNAFETNYGGGNWIRQSQQQFYRNGAGQVDSILSKYILAIGHYGEDHIHFYRDAGGLPQSSSLYRVDNQVAITSHDSVVYRYESYLSNGIPESPGSSLVQLYPNPVRGGKLFLRWGLMPLSTNLEAQVTDMSGRVLRRVVGVVSYPVQNVEIGELPVGTYVVRVRVGGEEVGVGKVGVE